MEAMTKTEMLELRRKHFGGNVALNYRAAPLVVMRAAGATLFDEVRVSAAPHGVMRLRRIAEPRVCASARWRGGGRAAAGS